MDYNFNLEHPFFFTNNDYSTDTSIKYQVSLPFNWHEVMNNDEWVYQYPIGKFVERQGWKIHISSEYNSSHELLQDVAKICHEMRIPFKHLSTEDKFIMRNGKLVSRGFSGKFITCYPNQNELESVLQRLESALKQYNGPYILSDKRWDEAPIYLRYGVFRPSRDDEKKVAIDELIVGDEVVKDERLPVFKIPKGIVPPDFLNKWLDKKDKKQGDFPFIIDNAIRFSNSGGIYNARLKEDGKKIILKEARPYTGLGFDGTYSSERLASECKALKILNEWSETPKIYWHGKIWEHTFLGIEHMKGVPLNRWVTNNFPLYEVVDKTKDYLLRVSKIVEKLIDLTNKFHSENVYHQDLHLGNILVKDEDEISIIDWEQAVFSNDEKVVHKVAAPGFRAWRETLPSEIDWYGIRQIAHYLYMPLVTTSDLTYNYVSQTRIEGKKLFESLGYTREHIDYVESLLSYLDSKCPQIENISRKKVLKPMHEIRTIESEQDIQDFIIKLLRGFTLTYGQWRKEFQSRFFPVHYYGLNFDEVQLERIAEMIETAERVYLYGKGSSVLALQEMKMRFMRLGVIGEVLSYEDMILWSSLLLNENCLVIGASISGQTDIVLEGLQKAADKGAKTVLMTTRKFDEEDCFFDELLLLASTDHLSYGNRISPQFPILLITDCLFSNYLESPERQYYYNQTIIHKEE